MGIRPRVLVTLALLGLFGCRNVDIPSAEALSGDGGGVGPSLLLGSLPGQHLALTSPMSFSVADVDGVASVSLSCSGIVLFTWTDPPYSAQVNLAPCQNLGTPSAQGGGLVDLVLTLTATDRHGNSSQASFTVTIDPSAAAITTDLPDRVRPGVPFSFHLDSDRALRGVPKVTIGGVAATVQELDAQHYLASIPETPKLGVDGYTGPQPPPADVLEDVERTLEVRIDAVALNGNATSVDRSVLLSRVQWEAALPAQISDSYYAGEAPITLTTPVAGPRGFLVPFVSSTQVRQAQLIPGYYAPDGGAISYVTQVLDGGYFPFGFDGEGRILADGVEGGGLFWPDAPDALTVQPLPNGAGTILQARADDGVCNVMLDFPSNCQTGTFAPQYACLSSAGVSDAGASVAGVTQAGSGSLFAISSGPAVLTVGVQSCADSIPTFMVGEPSTGASALEPGPTAACSTCARMNFFPLPVGDGTFALFDTVSCTYNCGVAPVTSYTGENFLLGPQGEHLGSYGYTSYSAGNGQDALPEVLNVLPDHRLVTLVQGVPNSLLSFYPPDAGSPDFVTLPGSFSFPEPGASASSAPPLPPPRDAVISPRGLAFVAFASTYKRAIIQLDASGQVRWIYWYPYVAFEDSVHLYGSAQSPFLYVTDAYNQKVVAIQP